MRNSWDRLLWGVEFRGVYGSPSLIGSGWIRPAPQLEQFYPGEPTRALVFCTRAQARAWCAERMAEWRAREDKALAAWRVSAVRVRERVTIAR